MTSETSTAAATTKLILTHTVRFVAFVIPPFSKSTKSGKKDDKIYRHIFQFSNMKYRCLNMCIQLVKMTDFLFSDKHMAGLFFARF